MIKTPLAGLAGVVLAALFGLHPVHACTTAVISGSATSDGRPLLWKTGDNDPVTDRELVVINESGKFRAVADIRIGQPNMIWSGVNEKGFCIENSVSSDIPGSGSGMGNGTFMRHALLTCETVADFQALLNATNGSRSTRANFGVIDRFGGAAIFETGPSSYTKYDANNSSHAPKGYVVRANFAYMGDGPAPDGGSAGGTRRYYRAKDLIEAGLDQYGKISLHYMLQHVSRDMARNHDAQNPGGEAVPGSINATGGNLPSTLLTGNMIARRINYATSVFHGVKSGEDPRLTTMWYIQGRGLFGLAVPAWPNITNTSPHLRGSQGAAINEVNKRLAEPRFNENNRLVTADLPAIWAHNLPYEDLIIDYVLDQIATWRTQGVNTSTMSTTHYFAAHDALAHLEWLEAAINQDVLHAWYFTEESGTTLPNTINTADPNTVWDGNLASSSTTGDGVYRIRRNGGTISRRANVGSYNTDNTLYMQVKVDSWNLPAPASTQPLIYFEFMNGLAENSPTQITASMRLVRQSNGAVSLQAVANGTGGTDSNATNLFSSSQTEPLTLLLGYNEAANTYTVDYHTESGGWKRFYSGTTSSARTAPSFRWYLNGEFNNGGSGYFDVDEFIVTTRNPVAPILQNWAFNDDQGTSLQNALNDASPGNTWSGTLASSSTTGTGVFRIQRDGSGIYRRADVGETFGANPIFMLVEIDGWKLDNPQGSQPFIAFDFMNGLAANTPSEITAGFRLERQSGGQVSLVARANGSGATSSSTVNLFTSNQSQKVAFMVTYRGSNNTYNVHYRVGYGTWTLFHSGSTAADRDALSFRMHLGGDFNGNGSNYLDLDTFRITTEHPALHVGEEVENPVIHAWSFNDPNGTTLGQAANDGNPLASWSNSYANSSTTGDGVYQLRRNGSGLNSRVDVGDTFGANPVYMMIELEGWQFAHTAGSNPAISFDFMNGLAADTPSQITAGVRLERQSGGQVSLEARALGTNATSSSVTNLFTSTETDKVTLVVTYNGLLNTYAVDYRVGTGAWANLHTGTTAADRSAISFRMWVSGDFDGNGLNFLNIGRFAVTTDHPALIYRPESYVFHAWRFDESQGTTLNNTTNDAEPGANWNGTLASSSTTGTGAFRLQRNGSGITRVVEVGPRLGADPVHLLVELDSWQLTHTAGDEPYISFSFADTSSTITAGVVLERLSGGQVALSAVANGTGGTNSNAVNLFSSTQSQRVQLLLTYQEASNAYSVDYRIGSGSWINFYNGSTAGTRTANFVRMYVRGDFNGGGNNHLDIDSILVTAKHPETLLGGN